MLFLMLFSELRGHYPCSTALFEGHSTLGNCGCRLRQLAESQIFCHDLSAFRTSLSNLRGASPNLSFSKTSLINGGMIRRAPLLKCFIGHSKASLKRSLRVRPGVESIHPHASTIAMCNRCLIFAGTPFRAQPRTHHDQTMRTRYLSLISSGFPMKRSQKTSPTSGTGGSSMEEAGANKRTLPLRILLPSETTEGENPS